MPSRRHLLTTALGTTGTIFSGCLFRVTGDTATRTKACSATPPPKPTDAATAPKSYPDGPPTLDPQPIKDFLRRYERAYQYNDALATYPDKVGRTNAIEVRIKTVALNRSGGRIIATVQGQYTSNFLEQTPRETTPTTPTETPLPAGHGPFETTYRLTDRSLSRNGRTLECW